MPEGRANGWPCNRMVCFLGMGNIIAVSLKIILFFILLDDFRWKPVHTDRVVLYSGLLPLMKKGVFPK